MLCMAPSVGAYSIIPRNNATMPKVSYRGVAELAGFMELDCVR